MGKPGFYGTEELSLEWNYLGQKNSKKCNDQPNRLGNLAPERHLCILMHWNLLLNTQGSQSPNFLPLSLSNFFLTFPLSPNCISCDSRTGPGLIWFHSLSVYLGQGPERTGQEQRTPCPMFLLVIYDQTKCPHADLLFVSPVQGQAQLKMTKLLSRGHDLVQRYIFWSLSLIWTASLDNNFIKIPTVFPLNWIHEIINVSYGDFINGAVTWKSVACESIYVLNRKSK